MIKHFAAACLLGTALVSAPAFAQDTGTSTNANSSSTSGMSAQTAAGGQFLTQMDAQQWRGSKLVGVDVYGTDNSKIGDINEVIVDRNGQAKAVVIGVGGFLGIGEKNVAIPWEKIQWNNGGSQASGNSGAMTAGASAGGQPAADRASPRDIAQTTTGSPNDPSNDQSAQSAAAGGAALSSAPSSGTTANAPANSSTSVSSAPSSSAMTSTTTSTSSGAAATGSASAQDYPDRALVSMSKQDLQNAPEFRYASQAASSSNASGGSSMTGSTGSTSAR